MLRCSSRRLTVASTISSWREPHGAPFEKRQHVEMPVPSALGGKRRTLLAILHAAPYDGHCKAGMVVVGLSIASTVSSWRESHAASHERHCKAGMLVVQISMANSFSTRRESYTPPHETRGDAEISNIVVSSPCLSSIRLLLVVSRRQVPIERGDSRMQRHMGRAETQRTRG